MRYSLVTLIALVLTSSFALAASTDQLAATKHNFSAGGFAGTLGQSTMCQPCHTPHHAITEGAISTRLWNHALSGATYTLYEGEQAAAVGTGGIPNEDSQGMDRVSRLCLGCHDGTVALDSFGMGPDGTPGGHVGTQPFLATNVNNLGTDFRDDHPVGIDAKALNLDGSAPTGSRLKPAVLSFVQVGGVNTTTVSSAKIGTLSLAKITSTGWVVGCKTCHNPHGSGATNLTPNPFLLYTSPAVLCGTCHFK
jgi:predicted CXXCH cytochrome family protein